MKKKSRKASLITSKDYHDYVIKDGQFIGEFELMYQRFDDPWHHGQANATCYDIMLCLMEKYGLKSAKVFDVGCGKGAFDGRVRKQFPKTNILAVDISRTAIEKAKAANRGLGIDFKVMDIQKDYRHIAGKFDLIIFSNILWYVLPDFKKIANHIKKNLKKGGYLLIKEKFYKQGEQKYGTEIVSSPEEMIRLLDYELVETIELNRQTNYEVVVLLKNG